MFDDDRLRSPGARALGFMRQLVERANAGGPGCLECGRAVEPLHLEPVPGQSLTVAAYICEACRG